ncbi:MAG: type III pantothenate kinase [Deltaproteobacteria bacterium]|nr:type III pantothenate kinase [Deltaproteobacteria bacterium]MBF0526869.1 type III pantothenate kinase [Deltaproteobacteria bacterium]
MLLTIDVGNTNIVIGVFEDDRLINDWRLRTEKDMTSDEFFIMLRNLFAYSDIGPADINDAIISCVVPPLLNILDYACHTYLKVKPVIVGPGTKTGMPIHYDNPKEVGADRIVNSVAAYERYKTSLIIVDFGTATTFDVVSKDGEYLGGAIAPGIIISCEALFLKASKLPRVELFAKPKRVVAKDTISSMNAGIIYGYAGLVDGIINRIKAEMESEFTVIATGGLARVVASETQCVQHVDDGLTLEGLRIIHQRNKHK